ncbi:hypothetical protein DFH06DRAFT_1209992 [Mycena polygramma]|nr:hypothetical protein DFH06DRAFT_1209992 [Mycena polygramma]
MIFSTSVLALVGSLLPLAALALPSGFKSVTTADLSSLSTTSKFLIASEKFNTQLNIAGNRIGDGNAVIMYTPNTASSPNQQWFLNNVVGSPNEYCTITTKGDGVFTFASQIGSKTPKICARRSPGVHLW